MFLPFCHHPPSHHFLLQKWTKSFTSPLIKAKLHQFIHRIMGWIWRVVGRRDICDSILNQPNSDSQCSIWINFTFYVYQNFICIQCKIQFFFKFVTKSSSSNPPNGTSLKANFKFFICLSVSFTASLHMSKKHVYLNNYWFLKVFFLSDLTIWRFNFSSATLILFLFLCPPSKVISQLICFNIQCLLYYDCTNVSHS